MRPSNPSNSVSWRDIKSENAEELIKRLRIAIKECSYQVLDRWEREQFIYGINDECIQRKIDSELTAIGNAKHVLMWAKQLEAPRIQALEAEQTESQMKQVSPCRYCRSIYPPQQCPAYSQECSEWQNEPYQCSLQRQRQAVNKLEEHKDEQINMVNTDHIVFNVKRSRIATKLNPAVFAAV